MLQRQEVCQLHEQLSRRRRTEYLLNTFLII